MTNFRLAGQRSGLLQECSIRVTEAIESREKAPLMKARGRFNGLKRNCEGASAPYLANPPYGQ